MTIGVLDSFRRLCFHVIRFRGCLGDGLPEQSLRIRNPAQ